MPAFTRSTRKIAFVLSCALAGGLTAADVRANDMAVPPLKAAVLNAHALKNEIEAAKKNQPPDVQIEYLPNEMKLTNASAFTVEVHVRFTAPDGRQTLWVDTFAPGQSRTVSNPPKFGSAVFTVWPGTFKDTTSTSTKTTDATQGLIDSTKTTATTGGGASSTENFVNKGAARFVIGFLVVALLVVGALVLTRRSNSK